MIALLASSHRFTFAPPFTRTSGVAASFRLAPSPRLALRLTATTNARCVRPTSASQHIHYEHPRLGRSWAPRSKPWDHGVSRRRESLRRARSSLSMRGVIFPAPDEGAVPLTLLSRRAFHPVRFHALRVSMTSAETASPAVLVKGRRRLRSGMPSLAGVTCSSNGSDLVSNIRDAERVLCRSRDFATAIRRSARFRSQPCPRNRFWRCRTSGCSLGPVREVSSFGLGGNESALLWARRRPTTSATLTTREHTLRAIDPRPSRERPRPLRVGWFP